MGMGVNENINFPICRPQQANNRLRILLEQDQLEKSIPMRLFSEIGGATLEGVGSKH